MELQVIEAAKAGDREAYGELIEKYYKEAYIFALSISGDTHDAMDICQDSFVKMLKNLKKLKDPEKFKGWLMKIVSNTSKDIFRKRKSSGFDIEELEYVFEKESLSDKHEILEMLSELKADHREVLILRYISGFKIREVAKIIGAPENTVKSRIRYALAKAKEIMEVE